MKNILVGVTGGISAYKSANIVSLLRKNGFSVKVVMTKSATEIITPLTLETLSKNRVSVDMWDENRGYEVEHISLAKWADIVLIAPTTYNLIGKVANGIADDLLTTIISAVKAPVYFALAMNSQMYENPILGENIEKLKKYNYNFIEGDSGLLACNDTGKGRLKDEYKIVEIIKTHFLKEKYKEILKGKKVLITAGRTQEPIDPIRYLSNLSSGKMGYSLAKAASDLGGIVTLVSGPTNLEKPEGIYELIEVTTAVEMYEATLEKFKDTDVVIGCAAVADYRPKFYSNEKIKKKDDDLGIELTRNPDILMNLGKIKKNEILIGFAAETNDLMENAKKKLENKNLDVIVANNASAMTMDDNRVTLIMRKGEIKELPRLSKEELAYEILKNSLEKLIE